MKTFECTCGNRLFFDSNVCLKCQAGTGLCPECRRIVPLVAAKPNQLHCGMADCGVALHRCSNFEENYCNCCVSDADAGAGAGSICEYCTLTTVIPDLNVDGNRERWARLERAKRRVLYTLDEHGFQFRAPDPRKDGVLSFEFKADGEQPVHTGDDNGCITINIREASDVERGHYRQRTQSRHGSAGSGRGSVRAAGNRKAAIRGVAEVSRAECSQSEGAQPGTQAGSAAIHSLAPSY